MAYTRAKVHFVGRRSEGPKVNGVLSFWIELHRTGINTRCSTGLRSDIYTIMERSPSFPGWQCALPIVQALCPRADDGGHAHSRSVYLRARPNDRVCYPHPLRARRGRPGGQPLVPSLRRPRRIGNSAPGCITACSDLRGLALPFPLLYFRLLYQHPEQPQ